MKQKSEYYSPLHPAAQFMIQRRMRIIREILAREFPDGGEKLKLLEIGCGGGQWLAEFQAFGFRTANFAAIELDEKRKEIAATRFPEADIRQGNAAELPWQDDSFDIVFQSTVFTSVLDCEVRKKIAAEMQRVCKSDGIILWYDFTINNPKNPDVRGVKKREIRELFAPWNCEFRSCTLAPPIARRIVPCCWSLAEDLETFFPFLRTHMISVIKG